MSTKFDKISTPKDMEYYNMTFTKDDKEIGILDWSDGVMKFKGRAEESAELFFDFLKGFMDSYLNKGDKK